LKPQILVNPVFGQDYGPGYVFFSYVIGDFISEGIALFQSLEDVPVSRVSHCGIITEYGGCIEATAPVICESDFQVKYLHDTRIVVFFRKPLHWSEDGVAKALHEVRGFLGRPYAYGGVAGSALYLLLTAGWRCCSFLRRWQNPLNPKGEMFCSELVTHAMRNFEGKTGCLRYDPSNVTPADLFGEFRLWKMWNFNIAAEKKAAGKKVVEA
jgi:hypothetical protein